MYLLNTFFVGSVIDATAPELCKKIPEKEDERNFLNVLVCMLTFDKMQITNSLICTKFEI